MNSIAKRFNNNNQLSIIDYQLKGRNGEKLIPTQLPKYKTFFFLFFYLTCLKAVLAQSFLPAQGLGLLSFTNNEPVFDFIYLKVVLARNFGSNARLLPLATPESYSCTSRISQRQVTKQSTKITAKNKTNPMVCSPIPILSLKTDISTNLDDPIMQNEPNGMFNRKSNTV